MSLSQLFSRFAHLLRFVACSCHSLSSDQALTAGAGLHSVYMLYFIALQEDAQLVHVSHCNATVLFNHAPRHITTWQGYLHNPNGGAAVPIYIQINYSAISSHVSSVKNSRA